MRMSVKAALAAILIVCVSACAGAAGKPADELVGVIKALMANSADWRSIEKVTQIKWAPLPPNMLDNCLPDGGCFSRNGTLSPGGEPMTIMASGARTMVGNFYIKNSGTPIGETALLAALGKDGLAPTLARCPVHPEDGAHNSKWWHVKSGADEGFVSLTPSAGGKPESIGLSIGPHLTPLDPSEVQAYSEQCEGGKAGAPVAALLPHEAIAQMIVSLIPAAGSSGYDWASLRARLPNVKWAGTAPTKFDASMIYDDPNPLMLGSSTLTVSERSLYVHAHGTETRVNTVHIEENGEHPRGEEVPLLDQIRKAGLTTTMARCGKPYTEAKYTYYRLMSGKTATVYLLLNERFDGDREQSGYHLYVDGKLPPLKPGEEEAGAGKCR